MAPPQLFAASMLSSGGVLATGATYVATAAGGTRSRCKLSVAGPAGGLLAAAKGARPAVVAAAMGAPDSSDNSPSSDREAVVSSFRMELELFRLSLRPIQLQRPCELLDAAVKTAQNSIRLFECLLSNESMDRDTYNELVLGGKAFVTVDLQCAAGYLTSGALINATQRVKQAGEIFFPSANMLEFSVASAPLSGDSVDKGLYPNHLVQAFLVYYIGVAWQAHDRYGFAMTGRS